MRKTSAGRGRYVVESVMRACDVLEAFRSESELLRIRDVAQRAGLNATTALRLLATLERRGLLERIGKFEYRLGIRPLRGKPYRIGYGSLSNEFAFSREVTEGVAQATRREGLGLLVLDNQYSPKTAIRNAEVFIREGVDLVIEFQADEHFAAAVPNMSWWPPSTTRARSAH